MTKKNLNIIENDNDSSCEMKYKNMLEDIKILLLFEWDRCVEECEDIDGYDIWKQDNKFTQIAKRNNITKDNIFEGIDEGFVKCYKYLKS